MVHAISPVDEPTVHRPELRVVTVASSVSLICIFCAFWSWMPFWKGFERFPGLVCILPFWMPYGFVLLRLHQNRVISGLGLAATMGCALFVPGVLVARFAIEWQRSWWIGINLAVALLMQPVMAAAALRALRYLRIVRRDWLKISGSFAYGTILLVLFWLAYSPVPRQIIENEASAKDRLREISWNNAFQYEKGNEECNSDHLSYLLRPNPASGYNLAYRTVASGTSIRGCRVDTRFTITARPITYSKTGIRSFLVDQREQALRLPQVHSVLIHFTSEDRPATLSDPADDVELFTHRPN